MENASKVSIHLRDLRERFLEFMSLQGIMRTQSLTILFLRLCFSHLQSSYIRV